MIEYLEVRFNGAKRHFEEGQEEKAIKHAQALDNLGYKVAVFRVSRNLTTTIEEKIYESLSFNPYDSFYRFIEGQGYKFTYGNR